MKKIFYEKVGRRYVPVSEYDSNFSSSLPKGTHLLMIYPGGSSTRYNVNPNHAALIAAGRVAEDKISEALVKAGELRMQRQDRDRKITLEQKAAWDNLVKEFGDSAKQLEWPSAREVAEAGIDAMMKEAQHLLEHPMARAAFDEFIATCRLVSSENKS